MDLSVIVWVSFCQCWFLPVNQSSSTPINGPPFIPSSIAKTYVQVKTKVRYLSLIYPNNHGFQQSRRQEQHQHIGHWLTQQYWRKTKHRNVSGVVFLLLFTDTPACAYLGLFQIRLTCDVSTIHKMQLWSFKLGRAIFNFLFVCNGFRRPHKIRHSGSLSWYTFISREIKKMFCNIHLR